MNSRWVKNRAVGTAQGRALTRCPPPLSTQRYGSPLLIQEKKKCRSRALVEVSQVEGLRSHLSAKATAQPGTPALTAKKFALRIRDVLS